MNIKEAAKSVELTLACGSWQEAQNIADHLLEQKLIRRATFFPFKARHWWEGEPDAAHKVTLLMESFDKHFKAVEAEIAKLCGYKMSMVAAPKPDDELRLTD